MGAASSGLSSFEPGIRRLSDRELLENTVRLLEQLNERLDSMTAGLEALQAKVDTLATEDTELIVAVEAAVTGFTTIENEIKELQTEHGTSDEELAGVTEAVSKASEAVGEAISKLHAAEPPAPAPGPVTTPQAVYLFVGPGTPEAPWSEAPFVTAEATPNPDGENFPEGTTLYYDAEDIVGAEPPTEAGVGKPGWLIYKGAVKE